MTTLASSTSSTSGWSNQLRIFFRRSFRLRRRYDKAIGHPMIESNNEYHLKSILRNCRNSNCLNIANNKSNNNNNERSSSSGLGLDDSLFSSDSELYRHKSLSLNDIGLYNSDELFDINITADESSAVSAVQPKLSSSSSKFKRTLSAFSSLSLKRRLRAKRKHKIMGQNSSIPLTSGDTPQNCGGISGGNAGSGSVIANKLSNKQKDSMNSEEILRLREEIVALKRQLCDRDQQLLKLHREIHKLKSVLDQTSTTAANAPQNTAAKPSITSLSSTAGGVPTKKCGVSGECISSATNVQQMTITKVSKEFRSKQLIKEALLDNSFLRHFLDLHQLNMIVDAMYEKEFAKGCFICNQGSIGSHLYVIAYGKCEIIDNKNQLVNHLGAGKAFGELALLYNCARTASVRAATKVRTWVLDRRVFQLIMMKTGKDKNQQYKNFLTSVPLLQNLSEDRIGKIVDAIEVDYYPSGDYICRQGYSGDSFYIISTGEVKVTQNNSHGEQVLRTLSVGDYFGEQALLCSGGASLRTANVISLECECLVLDRNSFHSLIGDLNELKTKHYEDICPFVNGNCEPAEEPIDSSIVDLKLDDLIVVSTLGIGGFGRVDLVRNSRNPCQIFALKSCSKSFVKSTRQEQHINNERIVQRMASKNQFVIKLYRTLKDEHSVYFVLEAALGGELWTLLRHRGAFEESAARFYVGCVIEALQFLHSQQIIYRDLKPENCLLDEFGYLKITDFGFSKMLPAGDKTWTFCGTPEYVAPEIILNRGHDHAVDFWSIGVLLYELLTGLPPFTSPDPLKTYNIILRGFDAIGFEEAIFSKNCVNLIRRLCKENPSERIGVQKNGFSDLKRHKWFSGFDWDGLVKRSLKPPIIPRLTGPTDTHYFDLTTETSKEPDLSFKDINECDDDYDTSWDKYF